MAEQQIQTQEERAETRVMNPFEGDRQARSVGAHNNTEIHRAVAEVQAAIMLAKQFPRDKREAMDKILTECARPSLADAAVYSYKRGTEEISGPSIRLAEVIAANWGNFKYGWKETGRHNGMSEITSAAWDYETNVQSTREFSVRHWRDTKQGGYAVKSERDIYEICANQAARRMRACILNVVPGDVIEAAVKQCELTMVTNEVVTPEKIQKLLEAFETYAVSKEHIEKRLGAKISDITPAAMVQLRKIYTGIKEGFSRPSEFFEVPEETAPKEKPKSDITSLIDATPQTTQKPANEVIDVAQKIADMNDKIATMEVKRKAEDSDWWSIVDELEPLARACTTTKQYIDFAADQGRNLNALQVAPPHVRTYWSNVIDNVQKVTNKK